MTTSSSIDAATERSGGAEVRSRFFALVRCCICFGCAVGLVNDCLGIFATAVTQDLHIGISQYSMTMTIINIVSAITTFGVSAMLQRYPLGRIMGIGAALCTASFLVMGSFVEIWQFYIAAVAIGAGMSCFSTLPVAYALQTWYGDKNGAVTGIAMGCSGVVGAIANPLCSALITGMGFRMGFFAIGILFTLFALPATVTMKSGPFAPAARNEADADAAEKNSEPTITSPAARTGRATVLLIALSMCFTFMGCMTSHMAVFGQDEGFSLQFAATMVSSLMIANILFKTLTGGVADRLGAIAATRMSIVISMVGCVMLLQLGHIQTFALIGALLFGASSALHTVAISLTTQYLARESYTKVFSKVTVAIALSYAIFISIAGAVRDLMGDYLLVFALALVAGIIALALTMAIRREHTLTAASAAI